MAKDLTLKRDPAPHRAMLIVYGDGSRSQPVEVTVEHVPLHGEELQEPELLATIRVDYEEHGNVIVNIEKGDARNIDVHVSS